MPTLDATNIRLVQLLQQDARASVAELARAVDRAESTVRDRLSLLERRGVLRGYRAVVPPEKLGMAASAMVFAGCDRGHIPGLAADLSGVPQVTRAFLTTGDRPLSLRVDAPDLERLERLVANRIARPQLSRIEVAVIVRTLVEDRPPLSSTAPDVTMPTQPS